MPQRAFEHSEKENLPHDSNLAEKTAVQDFALTFPQEPDACSNSSNKASSLPDESTGIR